MKDILSNIKMKMMKGRQEYMRIALAPDEGIYIRKEIIRKYVINPVRGFVINLIILLDRRCILFYFFISPFGVAAGGANEPGNRMAFERPAKKPVLVHPEVVCHF